MGGNSAILFSRVAELHAENAERYMSIPLEDVPLALADRSAVDCTLGIPEYMWREITRPFLETRLEVGL